MSAPLADIVVELPDGWSWTQRDVSPLTIEPPGGDGAFQISMQSGATSWRGRDPRALLQELLTRMKSFGEIVHSTAGEVFYGPYAQAECAHTQFGDVCVWALLPETHDPLLVSWLANDVTDAGKMARQLFGAIRPGLFSAAVAMAVEGARNELGETGAVSPINLLVGNGTITSVGLPFDDDAIAVQALRYERELANASVIAQIAPASANGPDGAREDVVSIYVESATRRKRFVMPYVTRATHEIDGEPPICDLFGPVDPKLIPMFEVARR